MKTLITSLFIIGGAVAVSACGTNYDGSPYFASGRTASHSGMDMDVERPVIVEKEVVVIETPAAVRSERVFRSTQTK